MFSCELATSGDDDGEAFALKRTEPALTPETIKKLQGTLNETRDISGFVVALRKAFKELANA